MPTSPQTDSVIAQVFAEVSQDHSTRKQLYLRLEKSLGKDVRVVSLFTSLRWPALILDTDADMLEEVIRETVGDKQSLILLLNSGGGDALAAERIVNICQTYGSGGFSVLVPKMAKSAATMICFGASSIGMSPTSELGPIDPQIATYDGGNITSVRAAHEIIESYEDLIRKANTTKGKLDPYLQQLQRYDARDIRAIRSQQDLSESIAITCLQKGMFRGVAKNRVKKKIQQFLNPKHTKDHGRPIFSETAKACGLVINEHEPKSTIWKSVWKLYIKLNYVVNHDTLKIIESSRSSYVVPRPKEG